MDLPENKSVVIRLLRGTLLVMRAVGAYHSHRLHSYMRALPCVLDYEHFLSAEMVTQMSWQCVLVVGDSFMGFCVAFAIHNMFLVTIVDAGVYRVVDVPGLQGVHVSQAQVVETPAEIPQLQHVEKAL